MTNNLGVYDHYRDKFNHPTCWEGSHGCPPHFHSALEIHYLKKGRLEAQIDGEFFTVRPGEVIIVPSYAVHKFIADAQADFIILVVPLDYIGHFQRILENKQFTKIHRLQSHENEQIAHALRILVNRTELGGQKEWHESFVTRGQIYYILGIFLESIPLEEKPQETDSNFMRNILVYISSNYSNFISLETLSKTFGYNKNYISKAFNQAVGKSLPEYLNTLRSRAAASLLNECGALAVADVAMEVGFDSMRTFYRVFKMNYGVTPAKFVQLPAHEQIVLLHENKKGAVTLSKNHE